MKMKRSSLAFAITLTSTVAVLYAADRSSSAVADDISGALYGGDCTNKSAIGKCTTPDTEPKCKATQGYTFSSGGTEEGSFQTYCTGDSQLTGCNSVFTWKSVCATTTQQ
jgi:hypothetical protein